MNIKRNLTVSVLAVGALSLLLMTSVMTTTLLVQRANAQSPSTPNTQFSIAGPVLPKGGAIFSSCGSPHAPPCPNNQGAAQIIGQVGKQINNNPVAKGIVDSITGQKTPPNTLILAAKLSTSHPPPTNIGDVGAAVSHDIANKLIGLGIASSETGAGAVVGISSGVLLHIITNKIQQGPCSPGFHQVFGRGGVGAHCVPDQQQQTTITTTPTPSTTNNSPTPSTTAQHCALGVVPGTNECASCPTNGSTHTVVRNGVVGCALGPGKVLTLKQASSSNPQQFL